MVWDLACYRSDDYAGFIALAGAFRDPSPKRCGAPDFFRHIHGEADRTVPMAGRVVLDAFRQGDVRDGFGLLAAGDAQATTKVTLGDGAVRCEIWRTPVGAVRELCLHPGGHKAPKGWIEWSLSTIVKDGQ